MTFHLARVDGRFALLDAADGWHDLARVAPTAPHDRLPDADSLHRITGELDPATADGAFAEARAAGRVTMPVPTPRNCFAVGLNYQAHAAESSMEAPEAPLVFTKFPSCLVGPDDDVVLDADHADYEVELVVVIGSTCRRVEPADAWSHVFGLTVGQDISDRALQFAAKPPHFDLGKSRDTYGPLGPVVVSTDAVDDPDDLAISCSVSGDRLQDARTSGMIFDVPTLIAYLSGILTLEAGDVIFTGTPDGVGAARDPMRFLRPGDEIVSTIEGIGSMTNRCR